MSALSPGHSSSPKSSEGGEVVVNDLISTANGLKFKDLKVRFHEGRLGEPARRDQPIDLLNDFEAVLGDLDR